MEQLKAVEEIRGCGYRKVGGLYLVGGSGSEICHRLPILAKVCPTCGEGLLFSRGFNWVNGRKLVGEPCLVGECSSTEHRVLCPICSVQIAGEKPLDLLERCGLIWIGNKFYTPEAFTLEADRMGISRRINALPRKFKIGIDLVLLAHQRVLPAEYEEKKKQPGIFMVWRPERVQKLVWENEKKEELEKLVDRGIEPVLIPLDATAHA